MTNHQEQTLEPWLATTESQREIWTACQLGTDASLAYSESVTLAISGAIQVEHMQAAIQNIVERHEALRTVFSKDGLSFTIKANVSIQIKVLQAATTSVILSDVQKTAVTTPFELEKGPLFRATVICGDSKYFVVLTGHHLVCDGWSIAIILRDLGQIYTGLVANQQPALPEACQFSAFAKSEIKYQSSEAAKHDIAYWKKYFQDDVPLVDIPCDRNRPSLRTFNSHRYDHLLPDHIVRGMKKLAAREKSSFFMALLGCYHILLWKILGDQSVGVAVPAAAQAVDGQFDLVGHCVNTLPIKGHPDPNETFANILQRTKKAVLDAYDHQHVTFGQILQNITVERDPSRIPLTPILFNVDKKFNSSELNFCNQHATYWSNPRSYEAFELFLNVSESDGLCLIECQYNTDLFSREWIQSHLASFETLMQSILLRPDATLKSLSWAPVHQLEEQYFVWNQRRLEFHENSVIDLFERCAKKFAGMVAVQCGQETLSYAELSATSNQWAHFFIQEGVKLGDYVGIAAERNLDLIPIIFGIFKAGACYVPMDPNFPTERLRYMLEHSGAQIVMTSPSVADLIPQVSTCRSILISKANLANQPTILSERAHQVQGEHLAYVIFTSGSTGAPKGVMVPHRGVVNFLLSMASELKLSERDKLLAVTTLSFDISVLELYLPLITGATVVLATQSEVQDGNILAALIAKYNISILQATPTMWRLLIDSGWPGAPLRGLVGGEALSSDLAQQILSRVDGVWNVYGPTETTVWSTLQKIESSENIDIGKALHGTSLYIVDRYMNAVPRYIPGELLIGGLGVTRGYLGRDDLTSQRFLHLDGVPDLGRVYRTGDLVRQKHDQKLEYLGRNDDQVKIRGFRIELGEIEAVLAKHTSVKAAVAMAREDRTSDRRLVGYVASQDPVLTEQKLAAWCSSFLPPYMIPQHIVILDRLPLLPNGKINRKALPAPTIDLSQLTQDDALRGDVEERVARIWASIMGLDRVPATRNFYSLGGHSLMAMRLITSLQQEFGVALSLRTFMAHNTVRDLAQVISAPNTSKLPPIPKITDGVNGRLSIHQERVYYLDLMDPTSVANLLPDGRRIRGPLRLDMFAATIRKIIQRHPQMRGIVVKASSGPMMHIRDAIDIDLTPVDLTHLSEHEQAQQLDLAKKKMTNTPLDVHSENLVRLRIFKVNQDEYEFASVFHHLIWDGWCFDIFWSEIHTLYFATLEGREPELSAPACHYLDFAGWHRENSSSAAYLSQLPFWQNYLRAASSLELPTDIPRPARRGTMGARKAFSWDTGRAERLLTLAKQEQTTTFVVMLALFKYQLSVYTSQTDITVGTPVRGRGHPDLDNVIGYFVNTLVLRTDYKKLDSFRDMIRAVKKSTNDAMQHDDIAFEDIIESLKMRPDPSRTTLYSTMFAYQDTTNRPTDWKSLKLEQKSLPQSAAGTDLTLWVRKDATGIALGFDYRTDLFSSAHINHMAEDLTSLLDAVLSNSDQTLKLNPSMLNSPPTITGSSEREVAHLISRILAHAKRRGHDPFLHGPSETLTGNAMVQITQTLAYRLQQKFQPGTKINLSIAGHIYDIPAILACIASGLHCHLRESVENPDSFVSATQTTDERIALKGLLDEASNFAQQIHLADEAIIELPGARLEIQTARDSAQYLALETEVMDKSILEVNPLAFGANALRWMLFCLTSADSIVLKRRSEDHPFMLGRHLACSTSNTHFLTLTQLANLLASGVPLRTNQTFIVSDAGVSQGILKRESKPGQFKFVVANENCGSWFAVAQRDAQLSELPWSTLHSSITITRPAGKSTDTPITCGAYIPGDVSVADNGPASWSGSITASGLSIVGRNTPKSHIRDQFLIHPSVQEVQYAQIERVLAAQIIHRGLNYGMTLLIERTTTPDERQELLAYINRSVPQYLRPDIVTLIDGLPMTRGGEVDAEHPILQVTTDDRLDDDAPETFAEKRLADIWAKLLGVKRIRRHDNFFALGGYSLLPLLMINDIERRTGTRLEMNAFLTQNLSAIAAQCGFVEPITSNQKASA